jgi:hypothetical protein
MGAVEAIITVVARDMMRDKDPVAGFVIFHTLAYFNDLSCNFVAEHTRGLLDTIPFHHIASAYSGSMGLYKKLTRPYLRNRPLLDTNVSVVVIH